MEKAYFPRPRIRHHVGSGAETPRKCQDAEELVELFCCGQQAPELLMNTRGKIVASVWAFGGWRGVGGWVHRALGVTEYRTGQEFSGSSR
jgi:hypothetical protein